MQLINSIFCFAAIIGFAFGADPSRAMNISSGCIERAGQAVHICVSISSDRNATTNNLDFHATFDYKTTSLSGWTAVGIGSGMFGSLMFIGFQKDNKPILSIRHGRGHVEPRPSSLLPEVHISKLVINGTNWFKSSISCYGCEKWTRDYTNNNQYQLIWAHNPETLYNVSPDMHLGMHEYKGHLTIGSTTQSDGYLSEIMTGFFTQYSNILELFLSLLLLIVFPLDAISLMTSAEDAAQWDSYMDIVILSLSILTGWLTSVRLYVAEVQEKHTTIQLAFALILIIASLLYIALYIYKQSSLLPMRAPRFVIGVGLKSFIIILIIMNLFYLLISTSISTILWVFPICLIMVNVAVVVALLYRTSTHKLSEKKSSEYRPIPEF